ncbi:DUF4328 domain-containing protein [Armatimonas sp.]|uniref:DUF4328 domain-containing protein n=1 Tax=Armatimonas sp. TaxID=1872638 RepID=UPI00286B7DD0|nr:DUF4328 domain-containing protein [Armatimonas sp.]
METISDYRELDSLTRPLKVLLWLGAAVAFGSLVSSVMVLTELNAPGYRSSTEPTASDLREAVVGIAHLVLYLVTVVVFARWIIRAHKNLPALGADRANITPGWAVGYFFVPFLNLWKPFEAMRELWNISGDPRDPNISKTPGLLGIWWGLWLVSNYLGQAMMRTSMTEQSLDSVKSNTMLGVADGFLSILLCIAAAQVVTEITQRQQNIRDQRPLAQ